MILRRSCEFLGALFFCAALGGCGPLPQPVMATIQVPTFRVHDQPEVTKEGLTVSIRPIMEDSVRSFTQLYKSVTYTKMVAHKTLFGTEDPTQPKEASQVRAELSIVPLPCFQVKIANHTGHVLRFTQVVFRLQSGSGQSYPLFAGTSEIVDWLENMWTTMPAFGPDVAKQVMPTLKPNLNSLIFLTRNTEILNGDEFSGYLVFNLNITSPKDYDSFLASVERLTLRLAEVPVALSEAGVVAKTTEFTFALDKVTAPMNVKCPPGTESPSTAVCTKEL